MSALTEAYYRSIRGMSKLVMQLIVIAFLVVIYHYLKRLETEKCECALTPQYRTLRRLVVVVLALMVFVALVTVILQFVYTQKPSATILTILYVIALVTTIVDIVFLVISLRYIVELYKISCQCSDNGMRLTYLIYTIIRLGLIVFGLIAIVLLFIFLIAIYRATSKTTSAAIRSHKKR